MHGARETAIAPNLNNRGWHETFERTLDELQSDGASAMRPNRGQHRMESAWTLSDLLRDLTAHGERCALIVQREKAVEIISCAELATRVTKLAAELIGAGLESKEPVALIGSSTPEWLIARLAIGVAGGIAVPVDDLASDDEASAVIRDVACRRAFATRARAAVLRDRCGQWPLQLYLLDALDDAHQAPPASLPIALPHISPKDPAMIAFTSGTTAAPKSFILTYSNIAASLKPLLAAKMVGPGDRVLLPLPLHHVYPFVVGMLVPLCAGATVVLPESLSARHLQSALHDARVSIIVGVPRLFVGILSGIDARVRRLGGIAHAAFRALEVISASLLRLAGWYPGRILFGTLHRQIAPDLRFMVSGGARLDAAVTQRLEALGWEVFSGYGLAETASVFTGNRPSHKRIGSEGLALTGDIRIGDAGADGVGEIQLRGPNVFAGYRNNPEATQAAFTADGWFRTGDLGYLDRKGYLHVTGRTKEVIVLGGGKKVLPEELEKVYAASPFIREVALLEREGVLCALVVPDLEAIAGSGAGQAVDAVRVTLSDLSVSLPPYKQLAGFALTSTPLPRTRLGKYRRFMLPRLYALAQSGAVPVVPELSREDQMFLDQPVVAEAWRLLNRRYAGRHVTLDSNPQLDLGIDSLEAIGLSLDLEAQLGVSLSEQSIAAAATVRDLLRVAEEAKSAQWRDSRPKARSADLHWLTPLPGLLRLLGKVLHAVNRLVMRRIFRLEASGIELMPANQPFLLAANHVSDLDALAIAAALPREMLDRVYWAAAASRLFLFRRAVWRLLSRALRIVPVDDRRPGASLALGAEVIKQGRILVWFPEEWRSPTGELQPFRPGVGHILTSTGAAALPALIEGTFEAWPRHRRWPRRRSVRIRFGRVHSVSELAAMGVGASEIERVADGLRQAVWELQRTSAPAHQTAT